jgi:ATP-dependent HslUV protease ATP-binding subunit HslU
MEKVLEDISFQAPELAGETIVIDAEYVKKRLEGVVKDRDLSRYIL